MISTVTTATAAAGGFNAVLGIAATLVLIALIVQRELAVVGGPRSRPLARLLSVAIAPFLVVFTATVVKNLAALI